MVQQMSVKLLSVLLLFFSLYNSFLKNPQEHTCIKGPTFDKPVGVRVNCLKLFSQACGSRQQRGTYVGSLTLLQKHGLWECLKRVVTLN